MTEHLSIKKRIRIESFDRVGKDVNFGVVAIDQDACNGCGYCIKPCPAHVLEVKDKKARMVEDMPYCIACGDCVAICPEEAIVIERFLQFNFHFTYLDRGKAGPPRKF